MINMELEQFMAGLIRRNPGEPEFHQAVREVAEHVIPFINANPAYGDERILERLTEPDRIIAFRVSWEDDKGQVRVNRGYRVQFNNAIGPYKGGLRFDRSVNQSILKFLAFEQILKNGLTTLPMGGAKGGSDFSPKGKSDREVMRFCQSFMTALYPYIGHRLDIPAGDIGVSSREIGYLFGQYKRLTREPTGTLTGKGLTYGGSQIRTEATGYGCAWIAEEILTARGVGLEGKRSAQYAAQKLIDLGVKVVTLSDRSGFVHQPEGLTAEQLDWIIELKNERRGRLAEYAEESGCVYHADRRPWDVPCDLAFPCATENELDEKDAVALIGNGCKLVCEGANMPCTPAAVEAFRQAGVLFAPGKAANAGGVAVSGMELTQNAMRLTWSREEVDAQLRDIMRRIHEQCVEYGREGETVNYVKGANLAGFVKVADAMLAYGII